jgi:DNA-directed RNA polymerase beta subunit
MVDDKIQARGLDGRRDEATKQPTKGRKNAGGGRMSTTIVNCLKANSVYGSLIEILTQSDSEYAVYCNTCGKEGYVDPNDPNNFICSSGCKNPTMFITKIPYVLKILQNFLEPALIDCKFKCTELMPKDEKVETKLAFEF